MRSVAVVALLLAALLGLPGGTLAQQGGQVCEADNTDDTETYGNGTHTPSVDRVEACGHYGSDGTFILDFTVVDADAPAPWPDDRGVAVYASLSSPDRSLTDVEVGGRVGGEAYIRHAPGDGVPTPYCPGISVSLTSTANTHRLTVPTGCIDADRVHVLAVIVSRDNQALDAGVADADITQIRIPPSEGAPPPLEADLPTIEDPSEVSRLWGLSRFETAVAISRDLWPEDDRGAELAVVATAGNFADAQTATPLAVGRGPLLLSGTDGLHPATAQELLRVVRPGGTVYLVGGTAALSEQVAADIAALGFTVQRLAGPGRGETSVAIAEAVSEDPDRVFFVDGGTFAPGILAGAAVGADPELTTVVVSAGAGAAYVNDHPDAEAIQIGRSPFEADVDRTITGADPTQLSINVAEALGYEPVVRTGLASAEDFPDGLAGSVHAATRGFALLLSPRDAVPTSLAEWLERQLLSALTLYGGVAAIDLAVSHGVFGRQPPVEEEPGSGEQPPAGQPLVGDGSQLADIPLGLSRDAAIQAFSDLLGPPDQLTDNSDIPGNDPLAQCYRRISTAVWGDQAAGLTLTFFDEVFGAWSVYRGHPTITGQTTSGVTFGMSQAEVQAIHPQAELEPSTFDESTWTGEIAADLYVYGHYDPDESYGLYGGSFYCGE